MHERSKVIAAVVTGAAVVGLALAAAFVVPTVTQAASSPRTVVAPAALMGASGRGFGGGDQTALADALGITTDELQAAQAKARESVIDQALDQGLITQAQADAMLSNDGRGGSLGLERWIGTSIDQQAALLDALGIDADTYKAAQETARDATLAQAVADGRMTQEQADLIMAQQALQQYIQDNDVYSKTIQQAVTDGVLTQAQADVLLNQQSYASGSGMMMRPGGRGGFGGPMDGRGSGDGVRGMGGQQVPSAPASSAGASS